MQDYKIIDGKSLESVPPNFKLDSYAARVALNQQLQELNILSDEQNDPQSLKIFNHHYLEEYPQILVSLSHTKGFGSSLVCNANNGIRSVGIDIELLGRVVKDGVIKFYLRKEDEITDNLSLWCLKEASYKALWPLDNKTLAKNIIIKKNNTFELKDSHLQGDWKLDVISFKNQSVCLARAYVK